MGDKMADNKKEEMVRLARNHKTQPDQIMLTATHSTGLLIQTGTGLPVTSVNSGPMGGDQQIGSRVVTGIVKAVIFMRDPLTAQPHEPDIAALMRLCDVHNVPLATNHASAEALLHFIFEQPGRLMEQQLEAKWTNEHGLITK